MKLTKSLLVLLIHVFLAGCASTARETWSYMPPTGADSELVYLEVDPDESYSILIRGIDFAELKVGIPFVKSHSSNPGNWDWAKLTPGVHFLKLEVGGGLKGNALLRFEGEAGERYRIYAGIKKQKQGDSFFSPVKITWKPYVENIRLETRASSRVKTKSQRKEMVERLQEEERKRNPEDGSGKKGIPYIF